jgi:hypothetical protein
MASGLPTTPWVNGLNGSHALDLSLTTHKLTLVNTTYLSGLNYDTLNGWVNTNEVSGTGWAAGGYTLATVNDGGTISPTISNGTPATLIVYDANNVSRASTTLTGVAGCVFWADAITTPTADPVYCVVDFGSTYNTSNGTFGITWAAGGILTLDMA